MKRTAILFILITLIHGRDLPPIHSTPDRFYDVIHSRIAISINFHEESVSGVVEHTIQTFNPSVLELTLDADDIIISSIFVGNRERSFHQGNGKVHVSLNPGDWIQKQLKMKIAYTASPRTGLYFVQPDSVYPNKHLQAWTQGEDQNNHHWVPLYDYPNDKATFEMIITVPDSLVAVSNGELISEKLNKDGTKTFHWKENFPMSSYLISFVVGDYVRVEDQFEDIPVSYWVYEENKHEAKRSFGKTPDMISYFNQLTGVNYPYEKYDQIIIEDFMFGGMENITLTHNTDRTMHDAFSIPDVSSDGLVAHELAHQWYGDLLTTRNWAHIWLNEGFATFFSRQYREHNLGYDEGEYIRYGEIRAFKGNDRWNRRPTVYNRYHLPMELFDSHVYAKGSLILNMLKDILSEDIFWDAIKHYTRENQFKNVETPDLKKAIEETTGQNLEWFFNQWVYNPGYPEYDISWNYNRRTKMVEIDIAQIQDLTNNSLFKMPIIILIDNGKIQRERIWVDGKITEIQIPSETYPKMVLFDEGNSIPKKITFNKSVPELIYQLKYAPHILDRIWAAQELKSKSGRKKVIEALKFSIGNDSFWGVRKESVISLANLKPKKGDSFFISSVFNQDNRVKRECVKALTQYASDSISVKFLTQIIKNEKNYYLIADAFSTLTKLDSSVAKLYVNDLLEKDSHTDVIRKASIRYFSTVKNDKNYNKLLSLAEYGGTTWDARATAVTETGKYYKDHPELLEKYEKWLKDPNYYVRTSAARLIGQYGNSSHLSLLDEMLYNDPATGKSVSMAKYFLKNNHKKKKSSLEIENEKLRYLLFQIDSILEQ
ncbi:MAG: M1 family metallopeptidase [Candidatus Marinimicrobia bacterium]|nr:M1 family metallopeptidase [Candidatus Neomarinimicrobiota bacterium]